MTKNKLELHGYIDDFIKVTVTMKDDYSIFISKIECIHLDDKICLKCKKSIKNNKTKCDKLVYNIASPLIRLRNTNPLFKKEFYDMKTDLKYDNLVSFNTI